MNLLYELLLSTSSTGKPSGTTANEAETLIIGILVIIILFLIFSILIALLIAKDKK